MVKVVETPEMVSNGTPYPKRSDVIGWCELIADYVAHGASAEYVRKYLKAISKSGWQLVNWLTHASGATRADAILALELTQHILGTFGAAFLRHSRGTPERCPTCGSYKVKSLPPLEDPDADPLPCCEACGWMKAEEPELGGEQVP